MNILLIQHNGFLDKTNPYTRSNTLGSLAIEYLAATVEHYGHQATTKIDNFDKQNFTSILNDIQPDIIGFSVYSYTYHDSLYLAEIAKNESNINGYSPIIVFGGYHPTACPHETAAEECVDFVVIGEGEQTLCELLDAIETKREYRNINGIAFEQNGEIILTPPRERIRNLDSLPVPKRNKEHLLQSKFHQISYPPPSKQKAVSQIIYSRGCPFSCSYCASELSWRRQVYWRDPKCVCNELEGLIQNHGTNLVFFDDLTFNASKQKLLELCSALRDRKLPVHWWGMFRLDLLDEEILEALVAAKCIKLSLGVESPITSETKKIKDQFIMRQGTEKHIFAKANELGLLIRAYLVIGFPDDTKEKIANYRQHLCELGVDEIRITFATPFPGTRFFNDAQKQKLIPPEPDWSQFSTEVPCLNHPSLSKLDLLEFRKQMVSDFYLSQEYSEHVCSKVSKFPKLKQSWIEYLQFLRDKNVFQGHELEASKLISKIESISVSKARIVNSKMNKLCMFNVEPISSNI